MLFLIAQYVNGALFDSEQELQCFNMLAQQQQYFKDSPIGKNFQKIYRIALALDNLEIQQNPSKFENLQDKGYVPMEGISKIQDRTASRLADAQTELDNDQEYNEILEDISENCQSIGQDKLKQFKDLIDKGMPLNSEPITLPSDKVRMFGKNPTKR